MSANRQNTSVLRLVVRPAAMTAGLSVIDGLKRRSATFTRGALLALACCGIGSTVAIAQDKLWPSDGHLKEVSDKAANGKVVEQLQLNLQSLGSNARIGECPMIVQYSQDAFARDRSYAAYCKLDVSGKMVGLYACTESEHGRFTLRGFPIFLMPEFARLAEFQLEQFRTDMGNFAYRNCGLGG